MRVGPAETLTNDFGLRTLSLSTEQSCIFDRILKSLERVTLGWTKSETGRKKSSMQSIIISHVARMRVL